MVQKATWIATLGDLELRLLEIPVPQGMDLCPLRIELYDPMTCRVLDGVGCWHLHEAWLATERLVAGANERHKAVGSCSRTARSDSMDAILGPVIARFPDRSRAIEELALRDEVFRSLCADFADAGEALRHWAQSDFSKRDERCCEYRELIADLAGEIRARLDCSSS